MTKFPFLFSKTESECHTIYMYIMTHIHLSSNSKTVIVGLWETENIPTVFNVKADVDTESRNKTYINFFYSWQCIMSYTACICSFRYRSLPTLQK